MPSMSPQQSPGTRARAAHASASKPRASVKQRPVMPQPPTGGVTLDQKLEHRRALELLAAQVGMSLPMLGIPAAHGGLPAPGGSASMAPPGLVPTVPAPATCPSADSTSKPCTPALRSSAGGQTGCAPEWTASIHRGGGRRRRTRGCVAGTYRKRRVTRVLRNLARSWAWSHSDRMENRLGSPMSLFGQCLSCGQSDTSAFGSRLPLESMTLCTVPSERAL